VEWEAHRAAFISGSVRLEHHIVVHCHRSALEINLRSGVSVLEKSDKRDWSSKMNPSEGDWLSASANQTIPCKHYREIPHMMEKNSVEWETHRAAFIFGSVRIKHHILVHLQHSAEMHKNLS